MNKLNELVIKNTKDILERNLQIYHENIKEKKIILVYDLDSELSKLVSFWYIENLKNNTNAEIILFSDINKIELREKLFSLEAFSTVIFVQSTNFRLEDFRVRMSLQHRNIWWIEHNHLIYIKDYEIPNYINSITYRTPYYKILSDNLKNKLEKSNSLKVISNKDTCLFIEWGFEDVKQNTWNYELNNRYWTFPLWENFTESKDFSKVNWELYVCAYPWEDFQVRFCEPFKIKVKESILICIDKNTPKEFLDIFEKIKNSEWNVMMRELWFWLNPAISMQNTLSDVNAFERMAWFHISIGKKHNIYRKKLHKDIIQRFHIDIFPQVSQIYCDDELIFDNWEYVK